MYHMHEGHSNNSSQCVLHITDIQNISLYVCIAYWTLLVRISSIVLVPMSFGMFHSFAVFSILVAYIIFVFAWYYTVNVYIMRIIDKTGLYQQISLKNVHNSDC
jgi:hypothetical protein